MASFEQVRDAWLAISSSARKIYVAHEMSNGRISCQSTVLSETTAPRGITPGVIVVSKLWYGAALPVFSGLVSPGQSSFGISPRVVQDCRKEVELLSSNGFPVVYQGDLEDKEVSWSFGAERDMQYRVCMACLGDMFHQINNDNWGNLSFIPTFSAKMRLEYCLDLIESMVGEDLFGFLRDFPDEYPASWAYEWLKLSGAIVYDRRLIHTGLSEEDPVAKMRRNARMFMSCLKLWKLELRDRQVSLRADADQERQLETIRGMAEAFGLSVKCQAIRLGVPLADLMA